MVSPRAEVLVFTPVAPHMTFNRSVVAAPDEPVGLRILERSGRAAVSVDGQIRGVVGPGDWIGVYASPRRLRAVRLGPMDFYGRLRERMNLTDAPAAVADGTPAPLWPVSSPRRATWPTSPCRNARSHGPDPAPTGIQWTRALTVVRSSPVSSAIRCAGTPAATARASSASRPSAQER